MYAVLYINYFSIYLIRKNEKAFLISFFIAEIYFSVSNNHKLILWSWFHPLKPGLSKHEQIIYSTARISQIFEKSQLFFSILGSTFPQFPTPDSFFFFLNKEMPIF